MRKPCEGGRGPVAEDMDLVEFEGTAGGTVFRFFAAGAEEIVGSEMFAVEVGRFVLPHDVGSVIAEGKGCRSEAGADGNGMPPGLSSGVCSEVEDAYTEVP